MSRCGRAAAAIFSQFITEPYPAEAIDIAGKFMTKAPSEVSDYFCSSLGGAEFSHALRSYVNGAYVNVPNPGMLGWETAYWGDHHARLREIKAKYDPDNVFQYEQSIQPA